MFNFVQSVTPAAPSRLLLSAAPRVCPATRGASSFTPVSQVKAASPLLRKASSTTTLSMGLVEDVTKDLIELYNQVPCMPIMVRLAWHDAGTFDASTKTGGANATIRFKNEMNHGANAGLQWAMDTLEPIKKKHPSISYADLYQLASIVAIKHAGGPTIPFRLGRVDAEEVKSTPDGRLPDATKKMDHLRDVFYRMGFTDKEIVVLSGAHALGRAHKDRSGFEGPWTKEPLKFDNMYFVEILKETPDPDLLRLASDMALLDEPETRTLCELYAKDQSAFFKDYAVAHQKLSELGAF